MASSNANIVAPSLSSTNASSHELPSSNPPTRVPSPLPNVTPDPTISTRPCTEHSYFHEACGCVEFIDNPHPRELGCYQFTGKTHIYLSSHRCCEGNSSTLDREENANRCILAQMQERDLYEAATGWRWQWVDFEYREESESSESSDTADDEPVPEWEHEELVMEDTPPPPTPTPSQMEIENDWLEATLEARWVMLEGGDPHPNLPSDRSLGLIPELGEDVELDSSDEGSTTDEDPFIRFYYGGVGD